MHKVSIIITTINGSMPAIEQFAQGAAQAGWRLILVGDTKTPPLTDPRADNWDVARQLAAPWELARALPFRHYSRKNIGYLAALSQGSTWIIDTDDDNLPLPAFWNSPNLEVQARSVEAADWVNPYAYFTEQYIWPRGLPLEHVRRCVETPPVAGAARPVKCWVQQGLANDNPDVDAVFRLTRKLPVKFDKQLPITLKTGTWAPFNSQNTIFHCDVAELLYLPSYCSFRMTDIWRSYVAQRVLWEMDSELCFFEATVYQERNEHNLLRDFEDEVEGYKLADKLRIALKNLKLEKGRAAIGRNVYACYEALVKEGAVGGAELGLVRVWMSEVAKARGTA